MSVRGHKLYRGPAVWELLPERLRQRVLSTMDVDRDEWATMGRPANRRHQAYHGESDEMSTAFWAAMRRLASVTAREKSTARLRVKLRASLLELKTRMREREARRQARRHAS